jgi:hypothetical protein
MAVDNLKAGFMKILVKVLFLKILNNLKMSQFENLQKVNFQIVKFKTYFHSTISINLKGLNYLAGRIIT